MLEAFPLDLLPALEMELRRGWHRERVAAALNQASHIRMLNSRAARSIDGVGQLEARFDRTSFHYWGQREGYECWDDTQFVREYLRDNPDSRVKSQGTRIQVGSNGRNVKWFKKYADFKV